MAAVVSSDSLLAAASQGVRHAANTIQRGMKMNRLFNESVIRQCMAALLPTLLTMGLTCGGEVFAATASASPGSRQLAMTTSAGPAYSVVKLGPTYSACINASGQVAFNNGTTRQAYFYNGDQFQDLGHLSGQGRASASAVNDYGMVVGVSSYFFRDSSTLSPGTPVSGMPSASFSSNCYTKQNSLVNSMERPAGNSIAAGSIGVGTTNRGFLWTPTKGMVDLGALDGGDPSPWGINNAGQVIGRSLNLNSGFNQGFFWSAADGMIDLTPAPGVMATPYAINNAGQVVGGVQPPYSPATAFLWTKAGGMVKLGEPGSNTYSVAYAINNKGQVVGTSGGHAFSWTQAGGMIDIGEAVSFLSLAINDLGQVMLPSSIWTSAGGKVDIGSLGGGSTRAAAINNLGQVVGSTNDQSGQTRAFVWTSAGGMVDLNTPGLPVDTPLQNATAIADNGSILATSSGGVTYLLIPNTRRTTSPPSESFFQRSPFQRLAPKTLIFP